MTTIHKRSAGFTLIEVLMVFLIIIALIALLYPIIFRARSAWTVYSAQTKIKNLLAELERYSIENRGYPTTEQGLYALLYVPNNAGMNSGAPVPPPGQFGDMTMDSLPQGGEASPESLMSTSPQTNMFDLPGVPNQMNPNGGFDLIPGQPGSMTGWQQNTPNMQLYAGAQKRSIPYIEDVDELLDPWGELYRYNHSLMHPPGIGGLNANGKLTPVIWSVGPDKIEGTADDIFTFTPADAQKLFVEHQQRMQQQGFGQQGGGVGAESLPPTGMGTIPPTGMGTIPPTGMGTIPPTGMGTIPPTGMGTTTPSNFGTGTQSTGNPYPGSTM